MDEKIECIDKNQTWEMVYVLKDKDVMSVKWFYNTKKDVDGNVKKHKERMVRIWFTHHPDIEFNENFAPIIHMDKVR